MTTKGRVLIVEDDPESQEMTCEVLRLGGHECCGASDGKQALEYLRAHEPPALILLDLMLPELDGAQVLAEIRKDPRLSATPVVLMSGERDLEGKVAVLGAAGALHKPFGVEQLLSTVGRFVPRDLD